MKKEEEEDKEGDQKERGGQGRTVRYNVHQFDGLHFLTTSLKTIGSIDHEMGTSQQSMKP